MFIITPTIQIVESEFEFSFVRSSGPGGQNVNKVNSKAVLRWCPASSVTLPNAVRLRFFARFANRLTKDGVLILTSDEYRDQGRNREACLEKLRTMLLEVAHAPIKRKKTKPSRTSVEKQKQKKRLHGDKKRQRKRVAF